MYRSELNQGGVLFYFPSLGKHHLPPHVDIFDSSAHNVYSQIRLRLTFQFLHASHWLALVQSIVQKSALLSPSDASLSFWNNGMHYNFTCAPFGARMFWTVRMDLSRAEVAMAVGVRFDSNKATFDAVEDKLLNPFESTNRSFVRKVLSQFLSQTSEEWGVSSVHMNVLVAQSSLHHFTKPGRCHSSSCAFRRISKTNAFSKVELWPSLPTDAVFLPRHRASRRELNTDPEGHLFRVKLLQLHDKLDAEPDVDVVLFHGCMRVSFDSFSRVGRGW